MSEGNRHLDGASVTADEVGCDRWSDLLVRAREGDNAALDQLLRDLLPWLFGLARRVLGNDADAWDAVQETALRLVRVLPSFDPRKASAKTWIRWIARNEAIDYKRHRDRRSTQHLDTDVQHSRQGDPVSEAEARERREQVRQALNKVRPDDRQAIRLRFYRGLTYAEVARTVHLPLGTVASRVNRGVRALAAQLGSESGASAE